MVMRDVVTGRDIQRSHVWGGDLVGVLRAARKAAPGCCGSGVLWQWRDVAVGRYGSGVLWHFVGASAVADGR